ncbi:alanine--tRNA ligase [Flavobacteriaceae bacterium]|jgi:alanyl-tRNA synthetase|nr:alanine--tRNA ligase [Flavobacteriaceae bacterium]MBT4314408.1 alanine--tRNA ligase [Flavobacteriaceae bacterium]MBT5091545.1 alanine--tRNA ligase [Flavobacteriaceae bacterium]MBT5283977.1 alanine--tRNA ligase [Flavobacteriaceae bacterium]MBT5447041.1 alanine--tRNA ligase [Flavobacteriaceae bacterium]
MKSFEVRQQFLDFFESKKHKVVPSAPMVIKNDPTLMFTNAGMNPFKEYFLGNAVPSSKRVTDTQKCLRVSGKHNDLEEVGIDTYHHTFFEMLGNWSFGDYFKKEAIEWAWELLTEVYKIDPNKLYVTIFEGAPEEGIEKDNEAFDFWKAILPEERILLGNKQDNFWEMGDQGPCGPCSEIHVDIRSEEEKAKVSGAELVNQDHPQVIEVWNLVFIEFNRKANGSLEKLPEKHIDTGMGFERLCMVLQNTTSNYDTDVFTPLIREIETLTKSTYGEKQDTDRAIRVIADHIRTVYFAIADGQLPSNNGAGYVIRRILRRAIRYGFTFLNQKEPFIHLLVNTLSQQMGTAFPELIREQQLAFNVIREEENSFLKTLDQGLVLLESLMTNSKSKKIDGSKVFELYDTFGFPFDLTALIAGEKGFSVDEEGFQKAMEVQKKRSRAAAASKAGDWVILQEDNVEEFVGYDHLSVKVKITRYRKMTTAKEGDFYQLVFNLTPFYPEGGGQVGDKGYLEASNGDIFYVLDTKKENNLIVHQTKSIPSKLESTFTAVVDPKQRQRSSSNHTATHLMHQALRSVLGNHVEQKGSMVHSGMFRFDFSHFAKVTAEELKAVEQFVNARIQEGIPLEEGRNTPYNSAIKEGAMALFGEKYGDTVRTIRFGQSIELCGGTHVANTAVIWHFKITSESAVASGIRRIEAITGDAAKKYFEEQTSLLENVNELLKQAQDPLKAIQSLQSENTALKKELSVLSKLKTQILKDDLLQKIKTIDGIQFAASEVDIDPQGMKDLSFEIGSQLDNVILVLGSVKSGKPLLSCYVSKSLVADKGKDASAFIRDLGKFIQGGGGGQPFYATAGGKNNEGMNEALDAAQGICI